MLLVEEAQAGASGWRTDEEWAELLFEHTKPEDVLFKLWKAGVTTAKAVGNAKRLAASVTTPVVGVLSAGFWPSSSLVIVMAHAEP